MRGVRGQGIEPVVQGYRILIHRHNDLSHFHVGFAVVGITTLDI